MQCPTAIIAKDIASLAPLNNLAPLSDLARLSDLAIDYPARRTCNFVDMAIFQSLALLYC